MTYNGWSNRETWLVNLWGNPESRADLRFLREQLEEEYERMPPGIIKDMVDLDGINWDEIESHFEEEEEETDDA